MLSTTQIIKHDILVTIKSNCLTFLAAKTTNAQITRVKLLIMNSYLAIKCCKLYSKKIIHIKSSVHFLLLENGT